MSAKVCLMFALLAIAAQEGAAAGTSIDGTICAYGSTCNQCVNTASYWGEEAFTACGTEPDNLPACTADAETKIAGSACRCGANKTTCGIAHFCYNSTSACSRNAKSSSCNASYVTAVGANCSCGGTFLKNVSGMTPVCTATEYCYDQLCNAGPKVVPPPAPPAMTQAELDLKACLKDCEGFSSDPVEQTTQNAKCAAATQADAVSECTNKGGWSTVQWILLGCGIAVALGLGAMLAAYAMGCFGGSKKRALKSSKKKRAVALVAPVVEEQQPLVAPIYAAPLVTYAAPMQYAQAPVTYAAPRQYAQQPMQYARQPVQTYAQPVATYAQQTGQYYAQ